MWRIDSIVVDNKMGELIDFNKDALAKAIFRIYEAFSKVSLSWLGRTSKLERKAIKSNQLSSIS